MKTLTYPIFTDATRATSLIVAAGIALSRDPNTTADDVFFGVGTSGGGAATPGSTMVYAPDSLSPASEATIDATMASYTPAPPAPKVAQVAGGGTTFTQDAQRTLVGEGVKVPAGTSLILSAYVLGSQGGTVSSVLMLLGAFRNDGSGAVQAGVTAKMPTGDPSGVTADFEIGPDGLVYVSVTGLPSTQMSWSANSAGTLM
jgi:hypothetical protein